MTEDIALKDNDKPRREPAQAKSQSLPRQRLPRKITETYLHNAGLYYLGRFAASKARFRAVMMRKVRRSCNAHPDQDEAACVSMVDALIRKFENAGLLEDKTYARGVVRSLRRRGKSKRHVLEGLKARGISPELALGELTLHDTDEYEDPAQAEQQAALIYARRKKLGPFGMNRSKNPEKDLACMARGGFSYETSRIALNKDPEDHDLL